MAKTKNLFEIDILAVKAEIENLQPKPKTTFTVTEIAQEFKVQISEVLKKGYTFAELVDAIFKPKGVNIDPNYLRKEYNKLIRKPRAKSSTTNQQQTVSPQGN